MILQIKKKYFLQIIKAFKPELLISPNEVEEKHIDYRDLCDFYIDRFCIEKPDGSFDIKKVNEITFKCGRKKESPEMTVSVEDIKFEEWLDGAGMPTNEFTFAIYINQIISLKNLDWLEIKSIEQQA